jgi:hypothetical protein
MLTLLSFQNAALSGDSALLSFQNAVLSGDKTAFSGDYNPLSFQNAALSFQNIPFFTANTIITQGGYEHEPKN